MNRCEPTATRVIGQWLPLSSYPRWHHILPVMCLLTLFASCSAIDAPGGGRPARSDSAKPGAACDWQPLFDGKTLKGWHSHGEKNVWRVENGEIVGELIKESPYAYLVTDERFADFELKLRMLFESKEGNSGIFFHCSFPPHCAKCNHVARELPEDVKEFKCPKCGHTEALAYEQRVHIHGPQVEFAPQNTGGLYESGGRGWLNQDKITEAMQKAHKLGEWNDFRLKAVGGHITVHLNGCLISDLNDDALAKTGIIALQLHSGGPMKVRFKEVYVRPATEGEK